MCIVKLYWNALHHSNKKQLATDTVMPPEYVSEWAVFRMLDNLQLTAVGLDGLPSWFFWVAVPIFCKTITYLFNTSLVTSMILRQWKEAGM